MALAGGAAATALAACAAADDRTVAAPVDVRVLVKLVRASDDASAISAEAARWAGVPVSHAAAASAAWHALALHCSSAAECSAAVERLRAAQSTYLTVEIEGRKIRSAT